MRAPIEGIWRRMAVRIPALSRVAAVLGRADARKVCARQVLLSIDASARTHLNALNYFLP